MMLGQNTPANHVLLCQDILEGLESELIHQNYFIHHTTIIMVINLPTTGHALGLLPVLSKSELSSEPNSFISPL